MQPANVRLGYPEAGFWLVVVGLLLAAISCRSPSSYNSQAPLREESEERADRGWARANLAWSPKSYPPLSIAYPSVDGAEMVNEDGLCKVCHKTHVESFGYNVHRNNGCESCHGPASRHLETRGREAGTIISFRKLKRAEVSEVCLKCHSQNACSPSSEWRISAHAHHGVTCTDCHTSHYNVPAGTPTNTVDDADLLAGFDQRLKVVLASLSKSGGAGERAAAKPAALPSLRGTSHSLGADSPQVCYRCHAEKRELERVAHPHQIHGQHGFECATCHNPHGNVIATSRRDLCLECHKSSPTAAWHSSIHDQAGVACTDCHNPHPRSDLPQLANIDHTSLVRTPRLPMSVNERQACAKCHSTIMGLMRLPSHHPVQEGKMGCSDCHDPHGQATGNLREETVNLTCYRCHADKQGPFVYEHPPVNEDCSICHNPHGTVTNNLLRQPASFLCLRCHSGHRAPPSDHFGIGTSDIDGNTFQRPVLYTNCTQCHSQIHGSDHPSQHRPGALLR